MSHAQKRLRRQCQKNSPPKSIQDVLAGDAQLLFCPTLLYRRSRVLRLEQTQPSEVGLGLHFLAFPVHCDKFDDLPHSTFCNDSHSSLNVPRMVHATLSPSDSGFRPRRAKHTHYQPCGYFSVTSVPQKKQLKVVSCA